MPSQNWSSALSSANAWAGPLRVCAKRSLEQGCCDWGRREVEGVVHTEGFALDTGHAEAPLKRDQPWPTRGQEEWVLLGWHGPELLPQRLDRALQSPGSRWPFQSESIRHSPVS